MGEPSPGKLGVKEGPLRRSAPPPRQAGRANPRPGPFGAPRHLPGKRGGQIRNQVPSGAATPQKR